MKTHILLAALCGIFLASCGQVALVQDRDPATGQFTSPVSPKDGQPATARASLYRFKGGDLGIGLWSDGSTQPKLQRSLLP